MRRRRLNLRFDLNAVRGRRGRLAKAAEAGQATIEYLLIVIIVVILILSILYQFHSSFRIYTQAFFDGYIRCLLEVGELPGTGTQCAQEFTAFNAKAGKPLLKDNLPEPGKGGTPYKPQPAPPKTAARETKSGGGGGGSAASAPVGALGGGRSGDSVAVGKTAPQNSINGGILGVSNTIPVGQYRASDNGGVRTDFSMVDEGPSGRATPPPDQVATNKKVGDNGDSLRPSKIRESLNRKPASAPEKESQFGISDFIRFIFILLIIIAIIFFFGGQVMQISRSREKGGD